MTVGTLADVLKPAAGTIWGIPFTQLPPLVAFSLLLAMLIVQLLSLRAQRGNPVSAPLSLRAPQRGAWQSSAAFALIVLFLIPSVPTFAGDAGLPAIPPSDTNYLVFYHGDHLGSAQLITEGNTKGKHAGIMYKKGDVIQRFEYAAYGRESFALNPNLSWDPAFTGQQYDIETGLYYYRARYYNPILGRFIQPDTIVQDSLDPQSWNRYAYVRNNPLKYVDPTGHWTDPATGMTDMLDDPTDVLANGLDDGDTTAAGSENNTESSGGGSGSSTGNSNSNSDNSVSIGEITVWGDDPKDSGKGPAPANAGDGHDDGGNGAGREEGGLVGAAADLARSIVAVTGMTYDWATGSGPVSRTFGPGSIQVREMMNAPGVNRARELFYKKNATLLNQRSNNLLSVTGFGAKFGVSEFINATVKFNPTRHFIGSYDVNIFPKGSNIVKFELTNNTSFESFLYGVGPAYERSTFGWGGNMHQTYSWTELVQP